MSHVTLYGAPYSVYTRIARLVLEEGAVPYQLVEIDIFDKANLPPDYGARQPFGKIPALEHDDFRLFETDAIAFYVTEALGGQDLVPRTPWDRARMRQVMRICDNYAYPRLVWGIYVAEREGEEPLQEAAVEAAQRTLDVLAGLLPGPYFGGRHPSLADLWALPMLTYLSLAPTGAELLAGQPALTAWLQRLSARPSVAGTAFPAESASEVP